MSSVAVPSDRRFRRAHVKPARKRRSLARVARPLIFYASVGGVVAYLLYACAIAAAHAQVLQIRRIVVRGNERLSQSEVLGLLADMRGENLLWSDLDRWRTRLLASPWIREAALRRTLPSTVEVAIWERQPIGVGRVDDDMYLMDERGVLIDQYGPVYADLDLPIVDGLSPASGAGGTAVDPERADLAARVIAAVRAKPDIARRVSQIDVRDAHNAAVILAGDSSVIELGEDDFLPRLQSYLQLAPALHQRVADIEHVDVRFDSRIYVRTAHPAKAPAAAKAADRRTGRKTR